MTLGSLPVEMVAQIFGWLSGKDMICLAATSKELYRIYLDLPYNWTLRGALLEEAIGTVGQWNQHLEVRQKKKKKKVI